MPIQPERIEDLLHRRSDLSTFLVHFTREFEGSSPSGNLQSILLDRKIEARSVLGILKGHTTGKINLENSQKVVCFTETPLEHSWMMLRQTDPPRGVELAPYGIAFPKVWGRRRGVNPIWYVDMTPGGNGIYRQWLTRDLDELRDAALAGKAVRPDGNGAWSSVAVEDSQIARIAPFIEQMVPSGTTVARKEFAWEREWRHAGDISFKWPQVVAVLAPEAEHNQFRMSLLAKESTRAQARGEAPEDIPQLRFIDPRWGLERMISRLAGIPDSDAGPYP